MTQHHLPVSHRDRPTVPRGDRLRSAAVVLALAGLVSLSACGDDAPDRPMASVGTPVDTTSISNTTIGADVQFGDIALPDQADAAGPRTERDGAVTQSYFAIAASPADILDFFTASLADQGWEVVDPVHDDGSNSLAGAWAIDGHRLEISATPATGVQDEQTQFSLVLLPSLRPGASLPGG